MSSKYRITFYSLSTLYLYLISRSFMLFCCLALVYSVSPLSSPRIFSTSTSLLPPTSTSLLPHFNPPSPFLPSSSSAARLHLLALTCLASSKFNWIANSDNQNPLPPLFPLCVALSRAVASDKHQQFATYRQKKKKKDELDERLDRFPFLVALSLLRICGSPTALRFG